jgi:O-antigen/teichoic acid export membrane protein
LSVIGKNILWLFVSQILTWMISLVLIILAPNRLGASDYGKFQFAVAFVGFFLLVGLLGTATLIIKTVSRTPDLLASYVYNTLVMKVVLGLTLSGVAIAAGWALGYPPKAVELIAVGTIGLVIALLNDTLVAALTGLQRMARPAAWGVVQEYVSAGVALVVLGLRFGVVAFAASFAVGATVSMVANARAVWPLLQGHGKFDVGACVRIARAGVPLMALSGLILLYGTIDIPLLQSLTNSETVGRYALAYTWVGIPVFISTIVVTAFFPSLSALAVKATEEFGKLANRALCLVFLVSVPASGGLIFVAHDLMRLIYNRDYQGSALLMQILAAHIPLAALSSVLGATLIASDRQNKFLVVAGIAAVSNPPLTVLAIKLAVRWCHNGAIGAAIVTVLTEMFIICGVVRLRRPGVLDRHTASFGARCLLASVAFMPILWIARDANILVKVALGATIYTAASFALRTISISQLRRAGAQLSGTRRGR